MKRASAATLPGIAPRYDVGARVRLVGLDRYIYSIAKRRKITKTWEYLIHDAHGRPCSYVYEDRLRAVEPVTRDRCPSCGAAVRVVTHRYDNYDVTGFSCDVCGAGGEV